jgi:F0F1-type ATP synthase assembly protein I
MNKKYLAFTGMGFELIGIILSSVYLGHYCDEFYGTKGLGVVGLSVLGLAGWITHVVLLSKKLDKEPEAPE